MFTSDKFKDLCPINTFKVIFSVISSNHAEVKLDADDRSAAIVRQSWNASTIAFQSCTFMADAGNNRGIFATILKMKLRKSAETGECVDFFRFKRNNDLSSERICGDYEATGGYTGDQTKFFADDTGRLKIHIEFDRSVPFKNTDTFEVMLVLTAYRKGESYLYSFHSNSYLHTSFYFCIFSDCYNFNKDAELQCGPGICISKKFAEDGVVNCPPPLCADEEKCIQQVPVPVPRPISGTNIAISAITSLVLTMVGVLCVCMCCKYKYFGSSSTHGPTSLASSTAAGANNNRRGPAGQRVVEADFQTIELPGSSDHGPMRPTAPSASDKDFPPSYESLFKKDNTIAN